MLAQRLLEHEEAPSEDHIVLLRGATWADYQRLLELRGERPIPRLAYLEGVLELMSPSREREAIKSLIGCLVETWCTERGVDFTPYGSWTLESKETNRGVEPDECYVFGNVAVPSKPDLAIEVVWTSGGVDKQDLYRALGVRELWIWRQGKLTPYVLRSGTYLQVEQSEVLPGIDLAALVKFLDRPTASDPRLPRRDCRQRPLTVRSSDTWSRARRQTARPRFERLSRRYQRGAGCACSTSRKSAP